MWSIYFKTCICVTTTKFRIISRLSIWPFKSLRNEPFLNKTAWTTWSISLWLWVKVQSHVIQTEACGSLSCSVLWQKFNSYLEIMNQGETDHPVSYHHKAQKPAWWWYEGGQWNKCAFLCKPNCINKHDIIWFNELKKIFLEKTSKAAFSEIFYC